MIYAFAAALAKLCLTGGTISFLDVVKGPLVEIFGAIGLGGLIGIIFGYFIRKLHVKDEVLAISLGAVLICTGLSKYLHVSLILSNLSLGMVFANLFLLANRRAYQAIRTITLPIYIIFFVIAGAHLQLKLLPAMGFLGLVYIVCRTVGLTGGAFFGATVSKAEPVIRKYLGLGILSQAGVAIGLAILVTREFGSLGKAGQDLALLVMNTIAATTILFEILGPIGAKIAITRAGEVGKSRR
jgi:Kef-type K+ transport system membrane component KefB